KTDTAKGEVTATAVLPGDNAATKLILQCIASPEAKELFIGIRVDVAMDFRTQGPGTFTIDNNQPVPARWALIDRLMVLNEVEGQAFNLAVLRQLATASTFSVESEMAQQGKFAARFPLDGIAEVARRLFAACGVQ